MNCPNCGETNANEFVNGDNRCKECLRVKSLKYRQTKKGFFSIIYSGQKTSSKKRGHMPPTYTKEEFISWVKSQKHFKKLWKKYKKSGFIKDLKPSCDRLDDTKGYSLCNMQLITWWKNSNKEHVLHRNGLSLVNDNYTPVIQYDLGGNVVAKYPSMSMASRATSIAQQNINKVCQGKRNTAGGFIWEYYNGN